MTGYWDMWGIIVRGAQEKHLPKLFPAVRELFHIISNQEYKCDECRAHHAIANVRLGYVDHWVEEGVLKPPFKPASEKEKVMSFDLEIEGAGKGHAFVGLGAVLRILECKKIDWEWRNTLLDDVIEIFHSHDHDSKSGHALDYKCGAANFREKELRQTLGVSTSMWASLKEALEKAGWKW